MVYHGIDTMEYPGNEVMTSLKKFGPFSWTGFHLGGPNFAGRLDDAGASLSWSLKTYGELRTLGYGIAPIFVGFQNNQFKGYGNIVVETAYLLGDIHGRKSVALATKIGFSQGTIIFLDVEGGEPLRSAYRQYILGFISFLEKNTIYKAGVYSCRVTANMLRQVGFQGPIWLAEWKTQAGVCPSTKRKEKACLVNLEEKVPEGYVALQYGAELSVNYGGTSYYPLDFNVSLAADPGAS